MVHERSNSQPPLLATLAVRNWTLATSCATTVNSSLLTFVRRRRSPAVAQQPSSTDEARRSALAAPINAATPLHRGTVAAPLRRTSNRCVAPAWLCQYRSITKRAPSSSLGAFVPILSRTQAS